MNKLPALVFWVATSEKHIEPRIVHLSHLTCPQIPCGSHDKTKSAFPLPHPLGTPTPSPGEAAFHPFPDPTNRGSLSLRQYCSVLRNASTAIINFRLIIVFVFLHLILDYPGLVRLSEPGDKIQPEISVFYNIVNLPFWNSTQSDHLCCKVCTKGVRWKYGKSVEGLCCFFFFWHMSRVVENLVCKCRSGGGDLFGRQTATRLLIISPLPILFII